VKRTSATATDGPPPADDPRARVLALLRRHGYNATSFQCLEDGYGYWFDESGEGCVAYLDTGRAWVSPGAPICAESRLVAVAGGFARAGTAAGRRVCFFAAEARLVAAAAWPSLVIGEQPVWDPRAWPEHAEKTRSLRTQLARARNKGVRVREVPAAEIADEASATRVAAERLIRRWLLSRKMAPMGFLVDVQPFLFPEERRYFVAEHGERVVGFLAAVPVYGRDGWFFEDFLRDPDAPNGTAELLIDAGMRRAGEDGSGYVTLGLAPLAGHVPSWLAGIRDLSAPLYDFAGLHAFKAKLRPDRWDAIHLTWPPGGWMWRALADSLAAFARGSFVGFGLRTLLRGPVLVLWALAIALVPWTAMLALADDDTWFPAPWVKWGWVGFDVLLLAGLAALALRFRRGLALALCGAITADALVTWIEAAAWNAERLGSVVDLLVVAAACAAPTLAAVVIWGATRRAIALERL
jgi:phosphatidylglycerol lysyltransferase